MIDSIDVAYIASMGYGACVRSNVQPLELDEGCKLVHRLAAEKGDVEYASRGTPWTEDRRVGLSEPHQPSA